MLMVKNCIIFGGSGFIGTHFSNFLLSNNLVLNIYIFDISPLSKNLIFDASRIHYIKGDVRFSINPKIFPPHVDLIVNLSAIHREPGHRDAEYYETNILGAENITNLANEIDCQNVIFTSSISPYGSIDIIKDEKTLPLPVTAYGSSKLVAEKIHQIWQARNWKLRRLIIVRPGVVFGPGENGNVTRLIKSVLHNYFFYIGNYSTRKAGVYVKELCNAMWWVFQEQKKFGEQVSIFNITMNPAPTIGDYVETICMIKGIKRKFISVPYKFLLTLAHIIDFFANFVGFKHPFSPVRIHKLVKSNNIIPTYLLDHKYIYQYSLESALRDWQSLSPEDWK